MVNLSSDKKRILVISDPHQDMGTLEYILKYENYDIAVCLGDFFDSFTHNSEYDIEATCRFLKKWVLKHNFYTCIGNHCVQYLYNNPFTICSGYEKSKDDYISEVLGNFLIPIREKFLWALWIDEYLCSHAGIHPYFFPAKIAVNKEEITAWLDKEVADAKTKLITGQSHWFYRAGYSRGGNQKFGGIVWLDADEEAEVIDGIKQIYGHTFHPQIIPHHSEGSLSVEDWNNICIDCNINQYLIIQNRNIEIKKFIDL